MWRSEGGESERRRVEGFGKRSRSIYEGTVTGTNTHIQLHETKYSPAGERRREEKKRNLGGNRKTERGTVKG